MVSADLDEPMGVADFSLVWREGLEAVGRDYGQYFRETRTSFHRK